MGSRTDRVLDRIADTKVGRDHVIPKVIEPVADWQRRRDGAAVGNDTAGTDTAVIDLAAGDTAIAGAARKNAAVGGAAVGTAVVTAPPVEAKADIEVEVEAGPTADEAPPSALDTPIESRGDWFKVFGKRLGERLKDHNIPVIAAGIAFWGLLAIPAVLAATLSIYGMVSDPDDVEAQIADGLEALPDDARSIVTDQLESVAGSSGAGLALGAIVGILAALWTTSGAVTKVIKTLNTIWGVRETRKFFSLRGLSIGLTMGAIVFVGATAFLIGALPPILSNVGLGTAAEWSLNLARIPALLIFMIVALGLLYWAGPNRSRRFRWFTMGAVLATLLWVVASFGFSIYTSTFASYNETYGALGGVVILLLWLFLTAFVVLLGAEIDATHEDLPAYPGR